MAAKKRVRARPMTVKVECMSCSGTGIYEGYAVGTGVVCRVCNGSGCEKITFRPFRGRKEKKGIERVTRSRGTFLLTGAGPTGKAITYKQFLSGRLPPLSP